MRKIIVVLLLMVGIVGTLVAINVHNSETSDYLRIHIRANSNSEVDQDVKYMVKGEIVRLLSPRLKNARDKDEAKSIVIACLDDINDVANDVLQQNNLPYRAKAEVRRESFPPRHYGNLTLEEGVYDALIIGLGSAKGDNWWCVVFPPLCFVESENVGTGEFEYVSKIKEIIDKYKQKQLGGRYA